MLDIVGLQNEDGSFSGDIWGEVDTRYAIYLNSHFDCWLPMTLLHFITKIQWLVCLRFSYIAICCLSILRRLDRINVDKAVKYIISCQNMDGGFGCTPGGESHAGQSMLYIIFHQFCLNITFSMILNACKPIPFDDLLYSFFLWRGIVCVRP